MGKTQSREQSNAGTVVNTVEVNEIHKAEVVNSELFIILYMMLTLCVINLTIKVYKLWQKNLKRRYITRALSTEQV